MYTENQILTKAFIKLLKDKPSNKYFVIQMAVAKKILNKYKLDDLLCLIDYLEKFPLKTEVQSLAYIPYIYDKYIDKAKLYKATLNLKEKDLSVERKENKIINNAKSSGNTLFKNNIKF